MKKIIILIILIIAIIGLVFLASPKSEEKILETENNIKSFNCGDEVTFIYRGEAVTYRTIESPNTGRCWLDRNLGADQVAISLTDSLAYGDLFQWGRLDDGHQDRDSKGIKTQAVNIIPGHNNFIFGNSDWLTQINNILWQENDFLNNPCPEGWKVPTRQEWVDEYRGRNWGDLDPAWEDLKLTLAGFRAYKADFIHGSGNYGNYWSSTIDGTFAYGFYFYRNKVDMESFNRAGGYLVRCIKIIK